MPLAEYRRKRRFGVTPEPRGKVAPGRRSPKSLAFVVQKHRASALHYDFRLEWKGVMRSWAVPRGPSYDPSVKRLAMQVEDHPMEYNEFEGIIPAGEYGGGTVMIWDRGTWTPQIPDVDAALAKGELKFSLEGSKLRGSWVLVRTRPQHGESKSAWLLLKHRDEWANKEDIAELAPRSIVSDRLADRDRAGTRAATCAKRPMEILLRCCVRFSPTRSCFLRPRKGGRSRCGIRIGRCPREGS